MKTGLTLKLQTLPDGAAEAKTLLHNFTRLSSRRQFIAAVSDVFLLNMSMLKRELFHSSVTYTLCLTKYAVLLRISSQSSHFRFLGHTCVLRERERDTAGNLAGHLARGGSPGRDSHT